MSNDPYQPGETTTGTDPDAKYEQPGYEDKSFGQAVADDFALVEELTEEEDDLEEAERRFREESAGAPVLKRQADEREDEVDDEVD